MYGNPNYGYQPQFRPPQAQQFAPQPQGFTPPTIHADIIQVGNEAEAEAFGVATGTSQMMCARDDSAFFVKTAYPNGQYEFLVYERRAPKQIEKPDYITRSELEQILAQYQQKGVLYERVREPQQTAAETDEG